MRALRLLPLVVLAGCGAPSAPPQPAATATAEQPTLALPEQPAPKPAPPVVAAPTDLGGKAVEAALRTPAALPTDAKPPTAPKPRASAFDTGDLPTPRLPLTPPASAALPKAKPGLPTPPPERAAPDVPPPLVGVTLKDRPLLKADGPRNPLAVDVPMTAWLRPDRASVDDPTVDLSAARIIATPLPLPTDPLPFLKLTIPDPFEFKEQLKGKVGRDAEFATTPVVVTPEKK